MTTRRKAKTRTPLARGEGRPNQHHTLAPPVCRCAAAAVARVGMRAAEMGSGACRVYISEPKTDGFARVGPGAVRIKAAETA